MTAAQLFLSRSAPALLALTALLTFINWYLRPDRSVAWAFSIGALACLALLLVLVPRRRHRPGTNHSIGNSVALAALMLAIPLAFRIATGFGLFVVEDLPLRLSMLVTAAFLVVTGNALPKTLTPLALQQCNAAQAQACQRFTGWTFVLTGLALGVAWLQLPVSIAKPVTLTLLPGSMLIVVARILWSRRSGPEPAATGD